MKINVALDWTPNINHIGFYVARHLGFYEQSGINIQLINPLDDDYATTPGKKLELNIADFAIAPFETVISLNNKKNKVNAVAVFAILQEDLSSIVTLKSSDITLPKQLDHKTYASYKARYEDHIVKQMMMNNGGKGALNIVYPDKLGIWNTLLEGKADATWIFDNWEGVEAETRNVELNRFRMSDFGIPYGYSPVILTTKENIAKHEAAYINFINATKQGYLFAKENQIKAVSILQNYVTVHDLNNIDIHKSLERTAPYFGDIHTCGKMRTERVKEFLKWLVENKLEDEIILTQELYTNSLIQ
jgi:ABC-type nitrate/sulfonate/bicarbonate transport system substrate-binding protein